MVWKLELLTDCKQKQRNIFVWLQSHKNGTQHLLAPLDLFLCLQMKNALRNDVDIESPMNLEI